MSTILLPDGLIPRGYISGLGRDFPHPKLAHLYEGTLDNPGWPMCRRGWNRDDGRSYSIWRNNIGGRGICLICLKRAAKGLDGIPPNTDGAPQIYQNKAFQGAYVKGMLAYSRGLPLSACTYVDKRGGKYHHVITYSRTFIKAWERGWWDAKEGESCQTES